MSFRLSIRSLLLLTLSVAIIAAFIASSNARTDNLRMTVALASILSAFIAIPASTLICKLLTFDCPSNAYHVSVRRTNPCTGAGLAAAFAMVDFTLPARCGQRSPD